MRPEWSCMCTLQFFLADLRKNKNLRMYVSKNKNLSYVAGRNQPLLIRRGRRRNGCLICGSQSTYVGNHDNATCRITQ